MNTFFIRIVNVSITASILVLLVLIMRLFLKKAPKWINVLLWSLVAFRLLCPIGIESPLSLIPKTDWIPTQVTENIPNNFDSIPPDNIVVDPSVYGDNVTITYPIANDPQIEIRKGISTDYLLSCIWVSGMAVMVVYMLFSYVRIYCKIRNSKRFSENVYLCNEVETPFVFGLLRPRIYLPESMDSVNMSYVISHEKAHIRRLDHLWKPLGFLLLTVHWFNPLMWIAYVLLCRDIEMACDERVVKEYNDTQRADYSEALLLCSVNRSLITACPLAFGEVSVKTRIKSVLSYKKPTLWIVIIALLLCIATAVFFLTDPFTADTEYEYENLYGRYTESTANLGTPLSETENEFLILAETALFTVKYKAPQSSSAPEIMIVRKSDGKETQLKLTVGQMNESLNLTVSTPENPSTTPYGAVNDPYIWTDISDTTVTVNVLALEDIFKASSAPKVMTAERFNECISDLKALENSDEMLKVLKTAYKELNKTTATGEDKFRYNLENAVKDSVFEEGLYVRSSLSVSNSEDVESLFDTYLKWTAEDRRNAEKEVFDPAYEPFMAIASFAFDVSTEELSVTRSTIVIYPDNSNVGPNERTSILLTRPNTDPEYDLPIPTPPYVFEVSFRDNTYFINTVSMDEGLKGSLSDIIGYCGLLKKAGYNIEASESSKDGISADRPGYYFCARNSDGQTVELTYDGAGYSIYAVMDKTAADKNTTEDDDSPPQTVEDTAISSAVREHFRDEVPTGLLHFTSYNLLKKTEISGTPLYGKEEHVKKIIFYLQVLHQKYSMQNGKPTLLQEDLSPAVLTFDVSDGSYTLEEYWEPRKGADYDSDLKAKVPHEILEDLKDVQSNLDELKQKCDYQISSSPYFSNSEE